MPEIREKVSLGLVVPALAVAVALSVNWSAAPAQASVNWHQGGEHLGSVNWHHNYRDSVNWN